MKRGFFLALTVGALLLSGCNENDAKTQIGDARKTVEKTNKQINETIGAAKKEVLCQSAQTAIANLQAASASKSGNVAKDEFKNALEVIKGLVPTDVRQAVDTLRATRAPIDPAHYSETQRQARTKVDNYLYDKCGFKLAG